MLIDNAKSFNLDLKAKDNDGRTGFQLAVQFGEPNVVRLIKSKMPSIAKN